MKHNISITMDQRLFRELENIRGREKRSTFIEHLIIEGLKTYKSDSNQQAIVIPIIPLHGLNKRKKDFVG
jgi:metal-responsive CopG/Arc/MetJ family transcriptional regulator